MAGTGLVFNRQSRRVHGEPLRQQVPQESAVPHLLLRSGCGLSARPVSASALVFAEETPARTDVDLRRGLCPQFVDGIRFFFRHFRHTASCYSSSSLYAALTVYEI